MFMLCIYFQNIVLLHLGYAAKKYDEHNSTFISVLLSVSKMSSVNLQHVLNNPSLFAFKTTYFLSRGAKTVYL